MLIITDAIQIEDDELIERAIRSSGPGGQNVNKVSTAIELRFNVQSCSALSDEIKDRLLKTKDQRITQFGEIVIHAQRHRSQARNRQDARDRLAVLIRSAVDAPTVRRIKKPTAAYHNERMDNKRMASDIKRMRKKPRWGGCD